MEVVSWFEPLESDSLVRNLFVLAGWPLSCALCSGLRNGILLHYPAQARINLSPLHIWYEKVLCTRLANGKVCKPSCLYHTSALWTHYIRPLWILPHTSSRSFEIFVMSRLSNIDWLGGPANLSCCRAEEGASLPQQAA